MNNRYYIGRHQTRDINDDYLGSGVELQEDINKYGKENFTKEVLFSFDNKSEMISKEQEVVNPDDPLSYNKMVGGAGGWDYVHKNGLANPPWKKHTDETKEKLRRFRTGLKIGPHSSQWNKKIGQGVERKWLLISPDGKIHHIKNLMKFCKENNLNNGALGQVAKGKIVHHKKWRCLKWN